MDNSQIGVMLCCGVVLVPLVVGVLLGRTMEHRIGRFGWPGALLPGFLRKILEDKKYE